jgi:N-acetylglucosaminyl-diphospho-decaprenol L-rhamnosyltransferase
VNAPLEERGRGPAVVVLTYRSAATIRGCLVALQPQVERVGGRLVVVDNASPDSTVAIVRALGVRVVESGANLGFAAGCNVGAAAIEGDPVVFVNPDAIVDVGALEALVDAVTNESFGPLGGRAHLDDGVYDRRSVLGRPSLLGALLFASGLSTLRRGSARLDPEHGPLDVPADGRCVPVPAVSGALLAVPRSLWDRLGGLDERFFLYGEDVDLSLRAAALGWRPTLVTGAGYRHVGGVSSAEGGGTGGLLFRGKVELYRQHLDGRAFRLALAALQFGTLVRGAPVFVPVPSIARRARPWWELFRSRHRWRAGYSGHVPGTVPV